MQKCGEKFIKNEKNKNKSKVKENGQGSNKHPRTQRSLCFPTPCYKKTDGQ